MRFEDDAERTLHARVAVLSPGDAAVSRMQVRVVEGYERRPKSLWREWLSLLEARPVKNGALMTMAAALVLFSSPVLGLLRAALAKPPDSLSLRERGEGWGEGRSHVTRR